jgi:hypothetical protein
MFRGESGRFLGNVGNKPTRLPDVATQNIANWTSLFFMTHE